MTDKKKQKRDYSKILFNKYAWLILYLATYAVFWVRLPPQIPLFYSQALRDDRLANSYALLILPAVVFTTFMINEKFLKKLALKNEIILQVISFSGVVLAAFTYILFLKILLLVV
jgi:hypothetical protein